MGDGKMQNIEELAKAAEQLLGLMNKESEMPLHHVIKRVHAALDDYPEDSVIKGVASVLLKRLRKDALAGITKNELYSVYNELSGLDSNNKFRDKLGDLLPETPSQQHAEIQEYNKPTYYQRVEDSTPLEVEVSDEFAPLQDMFGERKSLSPIERIEHAAEKLMPELRKYDKKTATIGKELVGLSFKMAGVDNIEAADILGDKNSIIYCVAVDSPYKKHYLFVPAQLKEGEVQWPEHFIADDKLKAIAKEDITDFITGKDNPGPDYNKLFEKTTELDGAIEVPKPLKTLVADIEETLMEVGSSFGREAVIHGKDVVKNELESYGCRVDEVKLASEHGDEVIFSAAVVSPEGKVRLDVPVEINDGKALIPTKFACGDDFRELNAQNLKSAISRHVGEAGLGYAYGSDVANMSYSELHDAMLYSIASKEYNKAEEVLNFTKKQYGDEKYKQMVSDYLSAMNAISKTASLDKCRGCAFFERAGKYHACDFCIKLGMDASKVVKTASGCMRYEEVVSAERALTNSGSNIKLGDE